MEYQGIIFDFNGTLFFDNDKHVKAWNEISKILRGNEITLEELHTKLNGTPNIQNILYFTDEKATKEELENITIPTLVFNGGAKDIVPKNEAEYISNNINNSELFIIEKAGHCNYIFNNKLFYEKLFKFLEQ